MKFCPKCANIYADKFETCQHDQTPLQVLPTTWSSTTPTVLIVLGIVVAIFVAGVVIVALTIPQYARVKKRANENSAFISLKAINAAELQYQVMYPATGYSCTLAALGGDPAAGSPGPEMAQLLDPKLAMGSKAGYQFNISSCTKVKVGQQETFTGYQVIAVPITVG